MKKTLFFILFSSPIFAAPNVVVSIKPIHSIVSNITQGVTTPKLLIKDSQSPHYFHLKPSQISLVNQADLLISVHPNIEEGIAKILNNIDIQHKLYVIEKSDQQHHNVHQEHQNNAQDYHIWLNIDAIQKFSIKLTNKLIAIDADNRLTYQSNLLAFNKKLDTLKKHIKKQLLPYRKTPMVTYSNAFWYFIQANQLNALARVVEDHELKPSVKNILNARKTIRSTSAQCLISTIEITPKRVRNIIENLDIKHRSVDIIGFKQTQGVLQYPALMQNIADAFEKCLK
ncbi:metal ABC transporter solute-binding protein, Zn/Mn family [Bathymodiolus septemdierum thioautotrophic gill symbiont]|uniref:High-affinity zinc uptake system protein ZnuA n=1 Tax=endosymbiont of Bathymodiolus septemdierum str. Myojin knoll TaxID=1303921 RepID=A0A0P0UQS7_9GAMM|nr:zinc ABC transporter substrate-binding protein [Bathymodiolus septemdierum thioautotrophic gill symbiont]BAS67392.1 zinc transport system substrate-binding protein [endosymbiont of Bathymodiolus septemdierum str. Myojin knoll]